MLEVLDVAADVVTSKWLFGGSTWAWISVAVIGLAIGIGIGIWLSTR